VKRGMEGFEPPDPPEPESLDALSQAGAYMPLQRLKAAHVKKLSRSTDRGTLTACRPTHRLQPPELHHFRKNYAQLGGNLGPEGCW